MTQKLLNLLVFGLFFLQGLMAIEIGKPFLHTGHLDDPIDVAFRDDGKTLVSFDRNAVVKLLDIAKNRELQSFTLFDGNDGTKLLLTPDKKSIARFSKDYSTMELFDILSGEKIKTVPLPKLDIYTIVFSLDGKSLVLFDTKKSVRFFDIDTQKEVKVLSINIEVSSVALSPDGKTILLGGGEYHKNGPIKLIDLESGKTIRTFDGHTSFIRSLAFSPDGKMFVSKGFEENYNIWEIETKKPLKSFSSFAKNIAFSPDGKTIAFGDSFDGTVTIVDAKSFQEIKKLTRPERIHRGTDGLIFSPDGKMLASHDSDVINIWYVENGADYYQLKGYLRHILTNIPSPDGKILVSVDDDRILSLIDAQSGNVLRTLDGYEGERLHPIIVFSPNGKILATTDGHKNIQLWDLKSGKKGRLLKGHTDTIKSIAFSSDSKKLISGAFGSEVDDVILWDLKSGKKLKRFEHDCLGTISPDGKTIATSGWSKEIKIRDMATGKIIKTFKGHLLPITSIVYSPDGKTLLSGSEDRTLKLWDLISGELLKTYKGHDEAINRIVFKPEGKVFTSFSDHMVKFWSVTKENELATSVDFYGGGWLTITPEGYFMASDEDTSLNLSILKDSTTVTSIDNLYFKYNRADLVNIKIKGEDIAPYIDGKIFNEPIKLPPLEPIN
jgi:WD40 repeat protein